MVLSEEQLVRYSRQMVLSNIGGLGQEKLLSSPVLVVGAGGLGSPVLTYLARSGVGTLGIVDYDNVELSNIHRQIIHNTVDIGKPKVISAKEKLNKINPDVKVVTYNEKINEKNIGSIIDNYKIVVDCLDNFKDKFLLNEFSVLLNKTLVHGGAIGFEGQILTIIPGKSACLKCFFPEVPDDFNQSCKDTGVLGTCVGVISVLMANEVLKLILGIGESYVNKVQKYNALSGKFYGFNVKGKNPDCLLCRDIVYKPAKV